MIGAMDADRFAALADAYGGQIRRWPQSEQLAAAAFAQTAEGRAILREADGLDAVLDLYQVPAPSPGLQMRILQDAMRRWARRRRMRFEIGLAGVGFAGMIAGMVMATILMPTNPASHYQRVFDENLTAFGVVMPDADMMRGTD